MAERPSYPFILIDDSTGYLDLVDNGEQLLISNALGFIKRVHYNFQGYDKNGFIWKISDVDSKYQVNGLTKILAYTFYNPQIEVAITWTKVNFYKLDELKISICQQVDRDDDILTQYVDKGTIKQQISNCKSFDEIISSLNKYVFKVDEDELWKDHLETE